MRFIFILAIFGMLLLQPKASSAQAYLECITGCTTDKSSRDTGCPPPSDEARAQCLQDNQDAMKSCVEICQQTLRAIAPKERPADIPQDAPETPKEN